MKKAFDQKTLFLIGLCVVAVSLLSGAWWFMNASRLNANDSLINVEELSDEFMKEYFDTYAEMTANDGQENILIVVSHDELSDYGAKSIVKGPNHTYYLMYDTKEERDNAYTLLAEDDGVSVEKNTTMELLQYMSWGIEKMGIDDGITARGEEGENVKVAIIDTGLDVGLFRQYYPDKGLDVYNVEADSDEFEMMGDEIGHGTHIAGTVAEGTTSNTSVIAIKADRNREIRVADVNTAIYKAIQEKADVINLSLGSSDYSMSQKLALDAANAQGIVTVAAAGNENSSTIFYPAGYENTISVAALDKRLERAVWDEEEGSGSNYNAMVDYAAPGTMIQSINGFASGTSMAAPHVTATVALLKNYNRDLGLDEVNALLRKHVVDLGEEGKDDYYGYGMIDLNGVEFCGDAYCDEYGVFAANVSIDDLTGGMAEVVVLDDGIMVNAEKACMVIISNDDGETYNTVPAAATNRDGNNYKFTFELDGETEVMVVLKGDVDMHGSVNARDVAMINYYLLSANNVNHRDLSTLELLVADVNNSNTITARDASLLDYALLSVENSNHRDLGW